MHYVMCLKSWQNNIDENICNPPTEENNSESLETELKRENSANPAVLSR